MFTCRFNSMEHASAEDILSRLKIAAKVSKDTELAQLLGLSRQSIAAARLRGRIPASWLPKASKLFNVDIEWLYYGTEKSAPPSGRLEKDDATLCSQNESECVYCQNKEESLKKMEQERNEIFKENRELIAENRQLYREKEALLREIGELREKVARLEERKNRLAVATDQPKEATGAA